MMDFNYHDNLPQRMKNLECTKIINLNLRKFKLYGRKSTKALLTMTQVRGIYMAHLEKEQY